MHLMYKIIVNNKTKEMNRDEFIQEQFTLKAKGKNFTVVYPSGYIAFFKPIAD